MKNGGLLLLAGTLPPWDARRDGTLKLSQGLELGNMIQLERHQPETPEKSPNLGPPSSKSNGTLGRGVTQARSHVCEAGRWGWGCERSGQGHGGRGLGRVVTVFRQQRSGLGTQPRNACQAAMTSAFREVVLLRRVTKKGITKQGMHTKENNFFFLHLLSTTPQNSLRKDQGRACCPCSGKVTGLHPVGGMPSAVFLPTRELAQPGLGKAVLRNGSITVYLMLLVLLRQFSLSHILSYTCFVTLYTQAWPKFLYVLSCQQFLNLCFSDPLSLLQTDIAPPEALPTMRLLSPAFLMSFPTCKFPLHIVLHLLVFGLTPLLIYLLHNNEIFKKSATVGY